MKTLTLLGFALLLTLSACGAPFTAGEFSEPGPLSAGHPGDAQADAGEGGGASAGAAGASSEAGTVEQGGSAGLPGAAGAPAGGSGETGSVAGMGGTGGAAGAGGVSITPPCGDEAEYFSGVYTPGNVPAQAHCFSTKETFNTVRITACDARREVRVNGGPTINCTLEPSLAWASVCTVKGDFSGADAEGYRYIQLAAAPYACGRIYLANEPDGEPCSSKAFEYSKSTTYTASDRVTAACEGGNAECEWRCMSEFCSGVATPKAPKWELVKSCGGL